MRRSVCHSWERKGPNQHIPRKGSSDLNPCKGLKDKKNGCRSNNRATASDQRLIFFSLLGLTLAVIVAPLIIAVLVPDPSSELKTLDQELLMMGRMGFIALVVHYYDLLR
jgi:hypothetical protein